RETVADIEAIGLSDFVGMYDSRYHSVNVTHAYEDIEKLEVRMHNGTTEFQKIAPWISLWMQIFNHARYNWRGAGAFECVLEGADRGLWPREADREDIVRLLLDEGILLDREYEDILKRRRHQLRDSWEAVLPRRVRSWQEAGWYKSSYSEQSLRADQNE